VDLRIALARVKNREKLQYVGARTINQNMVRMDHASRVPSEKDGDEWEAAPPYI